MAGIVPPLEDYSDVRPTVACEKPKKRRKRHTTKVVDIASEVMDLVNVPGVHRVDGDEILDDGFESKLVDGNDCDGKQQPAAMVGGVDSADLNHEGVVVEDCSDNDTDFIADSSSKQHTPMEFRAGTTVSGGGRVDSVVEGGGSSKAAGNSKRHMGVSFDASNVHDFASGHLGDNTKKNINEGSLNEPRVDNYKAAHTAVRPLAHDARNAAKMHAKMNFAGIFKDNRTEGNGFQLQFHDFMDDDVVLDENDMIPVEASWGFCLIGCFTGPFPGRPALNAIVNGWGVKCHVSPYGKGWTVFKFNSEHDRDAVFQGGPYTTYGKTLMLKLVDDGVMLTDDLFMKIPTWVQLHDVPPSVWSASGLSKLSSKVGVPLYTDKVTRDRSKMNFARCLIEVDVDKPPVIEFGVKMTGNRRYVQKVAYEHYPDFCCECKSFGHNFFTCLTLGKVNSVKDGIEPIGDVRPVVAFMPKRRVVPSNNGVSFAAPSTSNVRPNSNKFGPLGSFGSPMKETFLGVFGSVSGTSLGRDPLKQKGVVNDVFMAADIGSNEKDEGGGWIRVGKKGSKTRGGV